MINFLNLDPHELAAWFSEVGEKPFRAIQVLKWVHQHGVIDFAAMTNLSKTLRQKLSENFQINFPSIMTTRTSQDGTRKWLLQLDNTNAIEMVFIPEEGRGTLCISAQVGCALACRFCATAHQGFNRNLKVSEIIAQVWLAEQILRSEGYPLDGRGRVISNVVMMGMGEPLANFNNVVKALRLMMDDNTYGLSRRRITLSTAGIVPAITRLKEQCPVNLAVSLHAPDDTLRNQLMPINQKYSLSALMAACRHYLAGEKHHYKITFEYILLKDINDSPAHARALSKLLERCPAKVNLIPFNPFFPSGYSPSSPPTIENFREVLLKAGLLTVTRKVRGADIEAACGQLAGKVQDRTRHLPSQEVSNV